MARLRYAAIVAVSWLALLWERWWACFWPAVSLTFLFAALAFLNVPALLGPGGAVVTLALFAISLAVLFFRFGKEFTWPRITDAEREIEKASALEHRPLDTLKDTPAAGLSEDALSLWRKHLQQAALSLSRLKTYTPQTDMAARDRWALRYAALIILALGIAVAGNDAPRRLAAALSPDIRELTGAKALALDLWITPPDYTHEATTYLATSQQGLVPREGALDVPAGSLLKLRLTGPRLTPWVRYAGHKNKITELAPQSYALEMPLNESGTLAVQGWLGTLGQWVLNVTPDQPPALSISGIDGTARGTIKISYAANDDHGIVKLTGAIAVAGQTIAFDLPPPAQGSADNSYVEDLSASPAAGQPAELTLTAEDGAGNKTASTPRAFTMPERSFSNPLAQRIIAARKVLLTDKSEGARRTVAADLDDIAEKPGLYKGDIVVFLSFSSAIRRLVYDDSDAAAQSVADLLWNIALKLEDGGLSLAQRELSDALQKLQQALSDKDIGKQQLQAMMDDVQKKMQQYVRSLIHELQQRLAAGKKTPTLSPELAKKFIQNLDLNKLLDQMRQLGQANSREDLQKMAQNLQNAINNLDTQKFGQMQEKQAQAMEALQNLENIIHQQQALFDRTNKSADPADLKDQQGEQSDIRQKLGEALRALGGLGAKIPDNFAKADQAMKLSAEALGKSRRELSLTQQKTALDELQKGTDDAVKQMANAMQQSLMPFGFDGADGNTDPLGRPNGMSSDDSVKIPDEKERRRVQQIIEELRRRSNEGSRTKAERDYIDRLLDQF